MTVVCPIKMQSRIHPVLYGGLVCAVVLYASEFWNTKDYTQWTSEETNKILNDSPWAKQKSVADESGIGQRRQGRGGGYGGRGGGIGFPGGGGGIGYPGGGGGRYPGTAGGIPPDDRSEGRGGVRSNVVVRWESALPIQHALLRQEGRAGDDAAKASGERPKDKDYVIAMLGLHLPTLSDRGDDDSDLDRGSGAEKNERLRSLLLDSAQLTAKGKAPIAAEDVQFEGRNGSVAIRYLFPKDRPIAAEDKEVTFHFEDRGLKIEHKFKLSEMVYQGKLAL